MAGYKGNREIVYVIVHTDTKGKKYYGRWYNNIDSAKVQIKNKMKFDSIIYTIERMSRNRLSRIWLKEKIASMVENYDDEDKKQIINALTESLNN